MPPERRKQKTDSFDSANVDLSKRILIIRFILTASFILGIALSYPLWITDRLYPLTPLFSFLPDIPTPFDHLLVWIFCLLLAAQAFIPKKRIFGFLALSSAIMLAVFDQSRLHPWFYQYTFILAALVTIPNTKDERRSHNALAALQVMIIGMYIWGGLHKLNSSFYNEVVPWMYGEWISKDLLITIAPVLAVIEILIGVCLLFRRTRIIALVSALLMHLSIIIVLGPLGHNTNFVILPWNIAVVILLFVLFKKNDELNYTSLFGKSIIQRTAILLFFILPSLNTVNLWDSYMSFALYSGNTEAVTYYIDNKGREELPESIRACTEPYDEKVYRVDAVKWSNAVLHVPIYPERRIFESMAQYLSHTAPTGKVTMIIHERKTIFANTPSIVKQYP